MMMEFIRQEDLLRNYIKQEYAHKTVLVIRQDAATSSTQLDAVIKSLNQIGFGPPARFRALGYLIIEMPEETAWGILTQNKISGVQMELYSNGAVTMTNF